MNRSYKILPVMLFVLLATVTPAQVSSRHIFWKVQSDCATAYLLGSIHVGRPEMYPLDSAIEAAFEESGTLVFEIDVSSVESDDLLDISTYKDGSTLKDHLSADVYDKLKAEFKKRSLPEFAYKKLKPLFAEMNLSAIDWLQKGISPANGVETYFQSRAGSRKILALESIEEQAEIIDNFPETLADSLVMYSINELGQDVYMIDSLISFWQAGDDEKLNIIINDFSLGGDTNNELTKALLYDRNIRMTAKIEELLNSPGIFFIVVGAGHLVGEKGIINMLKNKYLIKRF